MYDQKGSSSIVMSLMLPLGIGISVFAGSYISWAVSHSRLQTQDRVSEDAMNLRTSLKMLLINREACRQNINSGGFGTSVTGLQSGKTLQIFLPKPNGSLGAADQLYLNSSSRFQHLQISEMKFDPATFIASNMEKSYSVDMIVKYKSSFTKIEKTLSIPFYFTADGSGNLKDCMATAYSSEKNTVEELICQQTWGADFTYLPAAQSCARKSSSMAQN